MPNILTEEMPETLRLVPYKEYTVAFGQATALADPTVTVFEPNTIGNVVWSRNNVGKYRGTLTNAFTLNKSYICGFGTWTGNANPYMPILDGSAVVGYYTLFISGAPDPDDYIEMNVIDAAGNPIDFADLLGDTKLYLPAVRVYY